MLSGRLVEIYVEEGTEVVKDQVVARIQFDDYENSLREAERDVANAKSRRAESQARIAALEARVVSALADAKVAQKQLESVATDLARPPATAREIGSHTRRRTSPNLPGTNW